MRERGVIEGERGRERVGGKERKRAGKKKEGIEREENI